MENGRSNDDEGKSKDMSKTGESIIRDTECEKWGAESQGELGRAIYTGEKNAMEGEGIK